MSHVGKDDGVTGCCCCQVGEENTRVATGGDYVKPPPLGGGLRRRMKVFQVHRMRQLPTYTQTELSTCVCVAQKGDGLLKVQ